MKFIVLEASVREERGTRACRALRHSGSLPCVVYGGKDSEGKPVRSVQELSVNRKELETYIHEGIRFVDVKVGEEQTCTILKDLQWDCFDDHLLHVDFERIDLKVPVAVTVPVVFKGISKGEKLGGKVVKHMQTISIRGLPRTLPENVVVRIDDLDGNESYKVRDIALPESVEAMTPQDRMIVEVKIKRAEEEVPAEEEAAEAEATT